ncbi:hypothetical protein WN66_04407 [Saccharomyces cerevisiae]|uniref:Putative uncharacterized membrane protein YLR230W n=2 Tax=Saccharomyces cerevisiae TaxID=4932 RepID=YL230_YEAST|nr:RecName: Full=Putative uncharacterized membrane protein YLR230W [Saccharomyces cerevisiae S288C]AHX39324.1 hypothetical protein YLR230W [Saccharomyces cerevisiae]KZV09475.1 hypothetical protein WN66_04407 [Saccharomyces cerevisiae]WNV72931.1 hypothetical protein O6U65_1792 [Saccharomyces cerevisiae synthetic construct]CAY81460.1 EC1118_1L7_0771p [Saccharomyces cerevisiae EC1118]
MTRVSIDRNLLDRPYQTNLTYMVHHQSSQSPHSYRTLLEHSRLEIDSLYRRLEGTFSQQHHHRQQHTLAFAFCGRANTFISCFISFASLIRLLTYLLRKIE